MRQKKTAPEYLLYVAIFMFIAFLPLTKIADFDLFFHLRLGEHVIEKLSIYGFDEFSYTYNGPQWRGEWLGNAVIYLAYKAGGFYGLGILKSALFIILCLIIWRSLEELSFQNHLPAKALTIIVFAYAMRFRLDLRPYYFSYIGLALFAREFIIHRYRPNSSQLRLWLLVPIHALWANMHSGFIVGLPVFGVFVLSEAVRTKSLRLLPVFLAVLFSGGLNPEGFAPYKGLVGFLTGGGAGSGLGEWQSLSPSLLWGFGLRYTWGFQALLLGSLICLGADIARKKFDIYRIALVAGSLYFSIRHVRLMDVSSILLAPLFYIGLRNLLDITKVTAIRREILSALLSATIAVLIVISVFGSRYYAFGFGPKEGIFPDGALAFIKEHRIGGNGFNTITVGSYMLWKSPDTKVFIDGRLIHPPEVQQHYDRAIASADGFKEADRKYNFNYAIVDYNPKARWRFPFHISLEPDWALVFWDEASVLYLKKNEANAPIIEKFGYRLLRPSFNDFSYLDPALEHVGQAVLDEVLHDVALNPRNQEAQLALAYVSYYLGRKDITEQALYTALGLPPDTAFEHISMAQFLLEKGDRKGALSHLKKALHLEPSDKKAKELLRQIK